MKDISPAIPLPEQYKLNEKFCDDFEGAALDRTKWNPICPWFLGRFNAYYYDPENVSVKDGQLHLFARMPEPGTAPLQHQLTHSDRYSAAFVQSRERIGYGYFEIRSRSMKANVCNAFWLHDPLDPPAKWLPGDFSEEIDIFEMFGKPQQKNCERRRQYQMHIHKCLTPYREATAAFPGSFSGGGEKYVPFDFYEDFHRYSLLWTPEKLEWFLDGELMQSLPNTFHFRPMYLDFDCEIMPWEGEPNADDLPASFDIDYVRVWQAEEPQK